VVGFAYSSAYRPRPGYRLTRETSVYLSEDARGQGLGRRMYDDLLDLLRADGIHVALALIALPNPASVALHEACGFEHLGTMREVGWKFDRWLDTAWYQLVL
jgi:L-amino acid N-acyltransferase YncA